MKYRVCELEDTLLDAAVALADGRLVVKDEPRWPKGDYTRLREEFGGRHVVRWYGSDGELGGWESLENQGSPSTDWSIAGPIIERERIWLTPMEIGGTSIGKPQLELHWIARHPTPGRFNEIGPTPLIAAMRAYCAAKLGDEVELP